LCAAAHAWCHRERSTRVVGAVSEVAQPALPHLRLFTTILDPDDACAVDLAAALNAFAITFADRMPAAENL
jgi:hypothetical protein